MFRILKKFLFFIFISQSLYADVFVRMEVQLGESIDYVNLRLFDGVAPLTVSNFLKYVNNNTVNGGNYDNSFIHRSATNLDGSKFVIQGGGFTFDPALNDGFFTYDKVNDDYPGGLQEVPEDPAIQNEFSISNIRGTIAMAKLGGDPNSATSQWFINLDDNSSILDGQNGGFTVFGEVILGYMDVVDAIASQPVYPRTDIHPAFEDLPFVNYTADPIQQENLVRINTITEVPLAPDITPTLDEIEFSETQLTDFSTGPPEQIVVFFNNNGNLDLNIISMTLDGADAADFEIFDNCINASPVLPGGFCVLPVNFIPTTVGDKSATLTVISDDPDESPLVIPITGTASIDTDGVPASVEDAAPNGGDGNNDGILDSVQNNVASFPGINGSYLTLIVSTGIDISTISVLSNDQLVVPSDNIQFELGVLDFRLDNVAVGGTAEVGLILPPGYVASSYYMYGPTPDNTNPHWYEFLFDGTTGAQLIGNATLTSPDGTGIARNLIRLIFKDGERGDADLSENGIIIDPGAPVVSSGDSGSGSMNFWLLSFLTVIILYRLRNVQSGLARLHYKT